MKTTAGDLSAELKSKFYGKSNFMKNNWFKFFFNISIRSCSEFGSIKSRIKSC
jgi:hypothetical protein